MAEEIQDGSLSWLARIDTSELGNDIKSIAELFNKIGGNVDLSQLDTILKQQADKEVGYRKTVAEETIKLNDQTVADAKSKADDLQKYIESIPFQFKTGEERQLSQAEIDAINAKNRGVPISNKSPDYINQPTFATDSPKAFSNTDAINQARDAYKNADAVTKQYFDDLVSLEFQLKNLQQAQTNLNTSLKSGNVTEEQYLTQSAQIKTALTGVTSELTATKNAHAEYLTSLNNEGQATTKQLNILTEYRQLRNQISRDQSNGIFNQADIDRAVELEHSIRNVNAQLRLESSNTAFIDAASEGVRGLVGGFSALSGVMGLLSNNNETANKIMQDTISFLGIIQGLEQISQVLANDGKLNNYIRLLLNKNAALKGNTAAQAENNVVTETGSVIAETNVATTEASAAAKVSEAVATDTATTATEGLNVAMAANPAAILLLAITALISAYELLANNTDQLAEAQKKLNEALDLSKVYLDDNLEDTKRNNAERLAQMKADGKSEADIRNQELKDANDIQTQIQKGYQSTIDAGNKAAAKLAELQSNNNKYYKSFTTTDVGTGDVKTVTELVTATKDDIDELNKTAQKGKDAAKALADATSDSKIKALENVAAANEDAKNAAEKSAQDAKKQSEKDLANDTEYWQAKVELARKGTQEWLDAQLKLNQAQYNKAIGSGANKTKADADLLIANNSANDTVKQQTIKDNEDIISARLDVVSKGSHEELALRLQQLELEKQSALITAKDNAVATEKILADSLKKQDDLKKQYAGIDAERFQEIQQNQLKIILSTLTDGTEEYLKFSKQANDQSAAANITQAIEKSAQSNPNISANDIAISSTFDEKQALAFADRIESIDKNLAVKIRAIWAETNAKNQQSTNDFINQQIDAKNKLLDIQADIAKEHNNKIIADSNASPLQKDNAELNNNQIDVNKETAKLNNLGEQLKSNYGEAGTAVSTYISSVLKDFSKIEELSNPDSEISHIFDGIKDPKAKEMLEQLLTALHALGNAGQQIKNQKQLDLFEGFSKIGDEISQLGSDVQGLNSDLGETLQTVGSMVSQLANIAVSALSGNVLGIISGAIGLVGSVIKQLSPDEATHKYIEQFQTNLVLGQIKYNEELLNTKKLTDDITQGMIDQLDAQIQLNDEKKAGYQTDLASLTEILEKQGKYIQSRFNADGSVNKDFNGIGLFSVQSLGIDSSMTDDQIAALLREKEATNQLTDSTKQIADQWLAVYDNITNATEQSAQLKEQLTEAFAGTTADDIAKSIVDGLQQGKVAAAQWGEDFNKIISNALLSSITNTLESGEVAKIWATLQANINPDGSVTPLSPAEIETLRKQYSDAVNQGNALLQQAESIFPDLAGTLNQSQTLAGAIQGSLTEDTANELAGITRGQYDLIKQGLQVATDALAVQQMIEANTAASLQLFGAHLPMLSQYLPFLKTINDNTVPAQIKRDFGL